MPALTVSDKDAGYLPVATRESSKLIYTSILSCIILFIDVYIKFMKTLQELGEAVASVRRELRLKQKAVAEQAGITPESLLRFERGQVSEFGSRKLLAVLAVLGMEVTFVKTGMSGSLDELWRERGGA